MFWVLIALLFLPSLAGASAIRICDLGDCQTGTECTNATTAWDHLEAAVGHIVANPELCDVVMWPGDIVTGRDWGKDCWCAAQLDPAPDDCTIYTNPFTEETCGATECGYSQARACDGGSNPGTDEGWWYCEFDRARNLMDALEAAGVPSIMWSGNHDWDNRSSAARCVSQWTDFNSYFGANKQSALFDEVGSYQSIFPCPSAPGGVSVQPDSHYYVLTAGGAQWLFIGISWSTLEYGMELEHYGMSEDLLNWVKSVLDAHPKMFTFVGAHTTITTTCSDGTLSDHYEDAWCPNLGSSNWKNTWTGMTIYDILDDYPQIGATFGGHIRTNAWAVTQNTTYPVVGMAFDYTDPIAGAPEWQKYVNGGGGIIQVIRVDPVAGQISTYGYSPAENGERVGIFGTEPSSHYKIMMPMCEDNVRFKFPDGACPELKTMRNPFSF